MAAGPRFRGAGPTRPLTAPQPAQGWRRPAHRARSFATSSRHPYAAPAQSYRLVLAPSIETAVQAVATQLEIEADDWPPGRPKPPLPPRPTVPGPKPPGPPPTRT